MAINFDDLIDYKAYYLEHIQKAKISGDQLTGLCPGHDDTAASFGVNLKTGQWICRAGCGSGNIINFHAKINNLTNEQSTEDLKRIYGNGNQGSGAKKNRKKNSRTSTAPKEKETTTQSNKSKSASTLSLETLEKLEPIPRVPLNYAINKRGWAQEVIDKYQIRFISEGKRPAYAIPIFDEEGNLANIRTYAPETEQKIMSWKKGFGSSRLFPYSILQEARDAGKPIILCEGEPDTLCGISKGLYCITHTTGAENWWNPHNPAFHDLDVIIAYDNDDAGRAGALKASKHLPSFARSVSIIEWPEWMTDKEDLTDFLVKYQKTAADFLELPRRTVEKKEGESDLQQAMSTDEWIEELNKHHAVAMIGGKCVVINETVNPAFGGISITYSRPDDFRNFYRNQKVWVPAGEGKNKQVDIGKVWLESECRRQYKGITFNPGVNSNGYYNLFQGFPFEPKKGDWSLFRSHIYNVIASHDKDRFSYLIAWMAHTVQKCGDHRPGVTMVLRGGQGSGKGCFATIFGRLFGPHFHHISQSRQLTGNFNQHLKDAILVFVDEGFWAGDKQSEGVLKAMISEDRIAIEPKGKDVFYVRNYMRLIVASNNRWIVPAAFGERRFCVYDVSPIHQQDQAYFNAIYQEMDNGGYEAMMYDLMALNINDFNLADFPKTEALFDQIHSSMPSVQKFWFEKLRSYSINDQYGGFPRYLVTASIYSEYLEFCKGLGERHPISNRSFTKEIKRMCPGVTRTRHPVDTGKREWCLDFPDLSEARDKFQAFVGTAPVDWDDESGVDGMPRDGPIVSDDAGLSHVAH